ncbi:MAG: Uma2 family endonuclease [Cellvibrionales bacterium]|nr:Uma2 family endonuclease [Cellvibrionales bacterium]
MAQPAQKYATYQDVLDAPPNMVAEIIAGTLYTHPRPASRHAWASSRLGGALDSPFNSGNGDSGGPDDPGSPGGWRIVFEPELHLGDNVVVPDLGGWRRTSMPIYPDVPFFTLAPDWACEVLSPSTRQLDLGPKRNIYAREGVSHLWLVDPDAQTLEAFHLQKTGQWLLIASLSENDQVSVSPFDAISFPLAKLWP